MKITPMGDSGAIIRFDPQIRIETHRQIRAFTAYLDDHPFDGMVEYVPAFTTVTIFYDPLVIRYFAAERLIREMLDAFPNVTDEAGRTIEIPVCYGGEFGPGIKEVAERNGMSVDEVISIHTGGEYLVYMVGFAPGFPYLGGMDEKIAAPRRVAPRLTIPAGTVGIAGTQTGVYPIETPGGWQLIGRTPIHLFRPQENPPSLLAAGDVVRFKAISREDFDAWVELR